MITLVFVAILIAVYIGLATIPYNRNPKTTNSKYDVDFVREKEMEIWGYYFTPAPENKAKPIPPKGSAGVGSSIQAHNSFCHRCWARVSSGMNTCHNCTQAIKRESQWRSYVMEHQGVCYRATLPPTVPLGAYAEIAGDPMGSWTNHRYMMFTWIDSQTGQKKAMRVMAHEVDKYEIHSDQHSGPVDEFFDDFEVDELLGMKRAPVIGTEKRTK